MSSSALPGFTLISGLDAQIKGLSLAKSIIVMDGFMYRLILLLFFYYLLHKLLGAILLLRP